MYIETLNNGLTLIVEEMPHFESVAYDLQMPGGIISDLPRELGGAMILSELSERGAGGLDSKALSDAYDALGARRAASVATDRFVYRGTILADTLERSLELLSLQITDPMLPEDEIDNIKELFLMDVRSLRDNPSRLTMIETTKRFLPEPYNRPSLVNEECLPSITRNSLKAAWQQYYTPQGAILSVAGNCTINQVKGIVEKNFANWKGSSVTLPSFGSLPPRFTHHIEQDTAQVQICVAYHSVKFGHPLYYTAKVANEILSGGMFGRLFIEVREKRGLCYSVHSRHSSGKHNGSVVAYSGTTPDRAHETLQVMLEVLKNLKGTVTEAELTRAKANLKASLIIGEESPGSRSSSNAGDYWLSKRVRTLSEIAAAIDAVTADSISEYVEQYSPDSHSLVTLGPKKIV